MMQEEEGTEKRKVIAVDLDEVLGSFVPQLCLFHNHKYGTSLTPEDFNSYCFDQVWGGSRSSADDKMHEFFESDFFLGDTAAGKSGQGIPCIEGALRVLQKHAAHFELHIVTSRQHVLQEHTRRWVSANYPGLFAELHFGNHFSKDGVQTSKPDLCQAISAVVIIDDNMRYATECAAAGIPAYLFGDYAWNRTDQPLPDNVKRTVCWAEVDAELEALLQSSGGSGSSGGGASNGTELEDSSHLVAGPSTSPAAAAVAAVVSGAATTAATGATENGEVGVAPPSNVVGEDVVTCAA